MAWTFKGVCNAITEPVKKFIPKEVKKWVPKEVRVLSPFDAQRPGKIYTNTVAKVLRKTANNRFAQQAWTAQTGVDPAAFLPQSGMEDVPVSPANPYAGYSDSIIPGKQTQIGFILLIGLGLFLVMRR